VLEPTTTSRGQVRSSNAFFWSRASTVIGIVERPRRLLLVSTDMYPDTLGCPVFDADGRVLGISLHIVEKGLPKGTVVARRPTSPRYRPGFAELGQQIVVATTRDLHLGKLDRRQIGLDVIRPSMSGASLSPRATPAFPPTPWPCDDAAPADSCCDFFCSAITRCQRRSFSFGRIWSSSLPPCSFLLGVAEHRPDARTGSPG